MSGYSYIEGLIKKRKKKKKEDVMRRKFEPFYGTECVCYFTLATSHLQVLVVNLRFCDRVRLFIASHSAASQCAASHRAASHHAELMVNLILYSETGILYFLLRDSIEEVMMVMLSLLLKLGTSIVVKIMI